MSSQGRGETPARNSEKGFTVITDYKRFRSLPNFERTRWLANGVPRESFTGFPRWSNSAHPPAIGSKVLVRVNGLGPGIVRGYFREGGYLGLMVRLTDPPRWWIEKNRRAPLVHVFGTEVTW